MNACERFLNDYTLSKERLPGHSLPWLTAMRESAFKDFAVQGLPEAGNENWKYTSLKKLQQVNYCLAKPQPAPEIASLSAKVKQHCCGKHCLVFINGSYNKQLSTVSSLPEGVILSSFAEAVQYHPHLLASALGKTGNYQDQPFSILNSAMMSDGVFLWATENTAVDTPIHCLFISTTTAQPVVSYSRLLLVVKNNARLTLLEHYIDLSPDDSQTAQANGNRNLLNTVTEIHLSPQGEMHHYKLQYDSVRSTHIAAMYVQQQQASHFTSHSYSLGAALARHDIQVQLCERQAECSLHGAYLVDRRQHVDYHTQIEHLAPACNSRQIYKGVVQGPARAVFNGKVIIHPDAQQSNAQQLNKNLLLGNNGEVDSKPELQIYADDVLCSHGTTVGQLDAQALFYLCSRGFTEKDAQAWLVYGFISEVLEQIKHPAIRALIEQAAVTQLKQLLGETGELQLLLPTENGAI